MPTNAPATTKPKPDEDFFSALDSNFGAVRARAVAGQGQTVALGRSVMKQNLGQVCVVRSVLLVL